ncbi:hypothetical protein DTO045G8_6417 [Paecilomyces variotii]|nr:hypothetical protein DTO045G8_6417 [Paecilomyces variotii]
MPDSIEDDDSISVTSTVLSEPKSEYEVECILTELMFPDGVKYLVKWEGYPVERSTWEPEDSFADPQTLKDWGAKKKAIDRGDEEEFDLETWENRLEALEDARDERKRKRRAKRARLGLPVSETEARKEDESDSSTSSDEPLSALRSRLHENRRSSSDSSLQTSRQLESRVTDSASLTHEQGPMAQSNSTNSKDDKSSSVQHGGKHAPQTVPAQPVNRHCNPGSTVTPSRSKTSTHTSAPLLLPRGPARDQRSLGGSLYARKQRLKAEGNDNTEKPTLFRNISTRWKYEKALRFEPAPDITQLDLRRPSDWAASPSVLNTDIIRPIRRAESNELFVRQDTPQATSAKAESIPQEDLFPERPMAPSRSFSTGTTSLLGQYSVTSPDSSRPPLQRNPTFSSRDDSINAGLKRRLDAPSEPSRPASSTLRGPPPRGPRRSTLAGPAHRSDSKPGSHEVEVRLFYGPEKTRVGSVVICGINELTKLKITSASKAKDVEVWFEHLCTIDQYDYLCSKLSKPKNAKFCNGWVEGYSYNTRYISEMAKTLRDGSLVGICYLNTVGTKNVLLAYATGSAEWDFLNENGYIKPGVSLRIAARAPLPPISELRRLPTIKTSTASQPVLPTEGPTSATVDTPSGPVTMRGRESSPRQDRQHPRPALTLDTSESNAKTEELTPGLSQSATRSPKSIGSALTEDPQFNKDTEMKDSVMTDNSIDLDAIFSSQYGISFRELASVNGSKSKTPAQVFYVWYPDGAEAEYQVLVEFLKRHKVVIYSNRLPEDWERFARTVSHGVVMFYGDFLSFYDLPYFLDLTRKEINFWSVSLAAPLPYADGTAHLQRLFPHGGVVLLTEDLFLYDQDCVVVILAWFEEFVRRRSPGSWKIMFRPDILNWLLKKTDEFETKSVEERKKARWLDMYVLILKMLPRRYHYHHDPQNPPHLEGAREEDGTHNPVISFRSIPSYGHRQEDEHDAIPKGLRQDQRDTDHLVEFFAGWSIINSHRFRRFIVASHYSQERWKAWNHLELHHGGRDFMKSQKIDANAIWAELVSNTPRRSDPSRSARTPRTPRTPFVPTSVKWDPSNTPGTVATASAKAAQAHHTQSAHKYPDPYV